VTETFLSAGEVSFHRAPRPVKERGDFAVRDALLLAEIERDALIGVEVSERGA
jgi:hypothetical protein